MPVEFSGNKVRLIDIVTVEEAEGLLEWLQAHPKGAVDLSACTHLHAANLQVLMAAGARIAHWPSDTGLAAWLKNTLQEGN